MDISKSNEASKKVSDAQHTAETHDGPASQANPVEHAFRRRWDAWWERRGLSHDDEGLIVKPRLSEELKILQKFTFKEQQEILAKREVLSSLAHFIGKDFRLPVYLGAPGSGWYWDPVQNSVTIDSQDVLKNPLSFLRFVTCHEGGHRRISRISAIPDRLDENGAFMMLLNGVEDPRVNNYLCEAYPVLEKDMHEAISFSLKEINKVAARTAEERGFRPDSIVAVEEIISDWFAERGGRLPAREVSNLTTEVKKFLNATRTACQRAYYTYPSRKETEQGDQAAQTYSRAAYRIIAEGVWPQFQKLVQKDMQTSAASELFKQLAAEAIQRAGRKGDAQAGESAEQNEGAPDASDQQGSTGEQGANQRGDKEGNRGQGTSQEGSDGQVQQDSAQSGAASQEGDTGNEGSTQQSQQRGQQGRQSGTQQAGGQSGSGGEQAGEPSGATLREAVKQGLSQVSRHELEQALDAITNAVKMGEVTAEAKCFSEFSDSLKRELVESIEHLPEDVRQKIARPARELLEAMQREVADILKGQLSPKAETPPAVADGHSRPARYRGPTTDERGVLGAISPGAIREDFVEDPEKAKFRDILREVLGDDQEEYHTYRKQVLGVIDRLERDLRKLFQERRASKLEEGRRFGPDMDLARRISECASGVSAAETRSFVKRTRPMEKDYAISILVDLSGSMRYEGRIHETFKATVTLAEVLNRLGINFEILGFNDRIHEYKPFHKRMGPDVRDKMATMPREINTDRACHNDDGWALSVVNERLRKERNDNKFLLVLSDGRPEPSDAHASSEYELSKVIRDIRKCGDTKLIGLGIGRGTGHVSWYYPNSVANIATEALPAKLAEILEQAIRHPEKFSK